MARNRILVCSTCGSPSGEAAAAGESRRGFPARIASALSVAGLTDQIEIGHVSCMGACQHPVALAFQGPAKATYLFAGVDPATDLDDIIATCRTWLEAPDGWIEDARPCGRLRHCLRARIPGLEVI